MTAEPEDTAAAPAKCACIGWRLPQHVAKPWTEVVGKNRIYEVERGGNITGRDFFWANVQPNCSNPSMSYEAFEAAHPDRYALCEAAAKAANETYGSLYVGQRDCVRATMCDPMKSQGRPELDGMCPCCFALGKNHKFRERVDREGGAATDAGSTSHVKHKYMTPDEMANKLHERAATEHKEVRNAARRSVTAAYRLAAATERAEAAVRDAAGLMSELATTADVLSEEQRQLRQREVELAIRAQAATAVETELATTNETLASMALAEAAAREQLAAERAARLLSEEDATSASTAQAVAEGSQRRLERALAKAQASHEKALSAMREAQVANVSKQEAEHTAELEAERQRSDKELAAAAAQLTAELEAERQRSDKELAAAAAQLHVRQEDEREWRLELLMREAQQREAALVAAHAVELDVQSAASKRAQADVERTWRAQLKAEAAVRAAEHAALPPVIQKLMSAHKLGGLDEHTDTVAILDDIATCLRNGSTRGRELSAPSKQLYGLLLNNGSAWAHKFVSGVLFGPDLRTSQKARAAFNHGLVELGLTKQSLKSLKEIHLAEYGLEDVPGIISEDASVAERRLDFDELRTETAPGVWKTGVKLWGFDGGTKTVHSVDELEALFKEGLSLANYVYVYSWVPVLPHAPWFPFAILATDNKFDNEWVFDRWRLMHEECAALGLNLAGHVSDGDSRLRKCDFRVNFGTNSTADPRGWCKSTYFLKHSLLMLSLAYTKEDLCIFGHQDYMHLAWRCRVQLLSPKKEWELGPGLRVGVAHLDSLRTTSGDKMLNGRDLDPHNKQHWPGVLKIFSKTTATELKRRIDGGEGHLKATYAVVVIFEKYLSSWLSDRDTGQTPLMAVEEAAMVLAFVMHWRHHVVATKGLSLGANFLTRETFLDIVTSCHGCIYRFPQFRDNYGGKYKPDGPRFSSAYSEYFFQYGRMAQCNSPVVSIKGWFTHAKHYLYQQFLEATSSIPLPASCRGIPHSISRVKTPPVPASYWPSDDELSTAVSAGVQKAIELLQYCGVNTNLTVRNGFFKHPCKHFPLADTYVAAGHCAEATTADKEDDPAMDEEVELTELDSADAADAQALIQQLMPAAGVEE